MVGSEATNNERNPRIYNLRFVDQNKKRLTGMKIGEKVYVAASVFDVDDGETATIKLKHDSLDGEVFETLTGQVENGEVLIEWVVNRDYYNESK